MNFFNINQLGNDFLDYVQVDQYIAIKEYGTVVDNLDGKQEEKGN